MVRDQQEDFGRSPSKVAAGILQVALFLLVLAVSTGLWACRGCRRALPSWMLPGIRTGADVFDREIFAKTEGLGTVTDLQWNPLGSEPATLVAAGNYGVRSFDVRGKVVSRVDFAEPKPGGFRVAASMVALRDPAKLVFFRQARPAATYNSLADMEGRVVWKTSFRTPASGFSSSGTQDTTEFILSRPDYSIERRDLSGRVLWQTLPFHSIFRLAVLAPRDADRGINVLLSESGKLVALDSQGKVLFKRQPPIEGHFSDFAVMRWPGQCTQCLLVSRSDGLYMVSPDGKSLRGVLRPADYISEPRALAIELENGKAPYLAVVGLLLYQGSRWFGLEAVHSCLYIFDPRGRLVYSEVSPEEIGSIGAMPSGDGSEVLLIGEKNQIWSYTMRATAR